MKYAFQIIDVFNSTRFGGNQLAVLPDAAGISTEGMQKIAREFNCGETTFVLPQNDSANNFRVRIFTPRVELDFARHPAQPVLRRPAGSLAQRSQKTPR